jgi:hypothetical protein
VFAESYPFSVSAVETEHAYVTAVFSQRISMFLCEENIYNDTKTTLADVATAELGEGFRNCKLQPPTKFGPSGVCWDLAS